MALIGIKSRKEKHLEIVEESQFSKDNQEKKLQEILEEHPELVSEGSITLCGTKSLPSRKTPDLILCNKDGTLTIAELKRGKASRDAVAQLLGYAAELHKMTLEEFSSYIGLSISELVEKSGVEEVEEETQFKKKLGEKLVETAFTISFL
ncbi:hypothetical protein AUJ65_04535 [Candidatus Micrarchaeota archaeon CG1_02_51_15]|nr:MAG: hypothetical protein AUJ65_04535 [Candidatus Micrarchaeota archaeon CG1_02_51_15]